MSVTPGKIGELFKCLMLKREVGSPYARSVPVVVNERLTDLVAVILLAALGVARYPAGRLVFVVGLAGTVAVIVVLALSPRFAERLGGALAAVSAARRSPTARPATAATFTALLRARHFAFGTLLGVVAWFCECVAFWLVFPGLGWEGMSLFTATFVYAVATLAGAVTFLPGGLGATEASMAAMLTGLFAVPRAIAVAATLIIRACTLWFAVVVGVVAYVLHMRRFGQVSNDG